MIVTEAEAKTKWCPKSQFAVGVNPKLADSVHLVSNRLEGTGERMHAPVCIGSDCMMWEWIDRAEPVRTPGPESIAEMLADDETRLGYCGLIRGRK